MPYFPPPRKEYSEDDHEHSEFNCETCADRAAWYDQGC